MSLYDSTGAIDAIIAREALREHIADLERNMLVLNTRIAELEPKAAAFDAIVKHKLTIDHFIDGEWQASQDGGIIEAEHADLLTAVQDLCKKIEGK